MKIVHILLVGLVVICACVPPTPQATAPVTAQTIENTPNPALTSMPVTSAAAGELTFPIRAAFYYPWFPQAWNQSGMNPFTHYHPSLGYYSQDDPAVIAQHIAAMQYGKIQAGIASWWGIGDPTDQRVPSLLQAGEAAGFQWALYIESEGQRDPTVTEITNDLTYIRDHYASSPAYWKIGGKFVVFVYADPADACPMADRWKVGNTVGAYVVLKVFSGYRACASQPDHWHQYAPAVAQDQQDAYSFTISPGFWKATEAQPRLPRNIGSWLNDIQAMIASKADLQLVTTFNEWGEGTSVESAQEWSSPSGYGYYLDALHYDGTLPPELLPEKDFLPTVINDRSQFLVGAGDIADCNLKGVAATSQLLDGFPSADIFTAGDSTYQDGTPAEFQDCFDPTWGRYKARIHPAPGNHEYHTTNAAGYFGYFGTAAGDPSKGYYSYDIGNWHVIVLNSNCDEVACSPGSPQETWLKADLAAHPSKCTLAYWHHPRFSSGKHGNNTSVSAFWTDLYAAGAELVINGHDHIYERFAPQDPAANLDLQKGIREIVVGTGGANLTNISATRQPNSQVAISKTYGILELALQSNAFSWNFIPVDGKTATDSGSQDCH